MGSQRLAVGAVGVNGDEETGGDPWRVTAASLG